MQYQTFRATAFLAVFLCAMQTPTPTFAKAIDRDVRAFGYNKNVYQLMKLMEKFRHYNIDPEFSLSNIIKHMMESDSEVSKNDILDVIEHLESLIAQNAHLNNEQMAQLEEVFNDAVHAIESDNDISPELFVNVDKIFSAHKASTRRNIAMDDEVRGKEKSNKPCDKPCSKPCDNKPCKPCDKICDDSKIFFNHVFMENGLDVKCNTRLQKLHAKEADIHNLEARKAKIHKLKVDDARIDNAQINNAVITDATITNAQITNADVTNLNVGNETVCDLVVDCNIFMQDSTVAVGNIFKAGERFIHNFGIDNTFVGKNAGNFTMTGDSNSGFGVNALQSNTTGFWNAAVGTDAMQNNTIGQQNTAVGYNALLNNTTGSVNTAVGTFALQLNTTGDTNTAVGVSAMQNNTTGRGNAAFGTAAMSGNATGRGNTALGAFALFGFSGASTGNDNTVVGNNAMINITGGSSNTAIGRQAGVIITTGNNNVAVGAGAMFNNSVGNDNVFVGVNTFGTGSENVIVGRGAGNNGDQNTCLGFRSLFDVNSTNNVAIGHHAMRNSSSANGFNTVIGNNVFLNGQGGNNIIMGASAGNNYFGTENNNIIIGNLGTGGDNFTIRIGTTGTHTRNFQAGIFGAGPIVGAPVLVDAAGQLGTVPSSIRYKENVQDMAQDSSPILNLRPVTFNYKSDELQTKQFGLIAEEVQNVLPALVVRGADGEIETVKYHELAVLLLNEMIKQQAIIESLNARVAQLEARA